ncbi:DUF6455 family protein [Pseudooceanicola sp. MF1-13]|uniref:DUF6455 family protein n=1 Tax=Pseudooceanicola sp. MF1-13 TaxID=3379095 RepID=UPI003892C1A5
MAPRGDIYTHLQLVRRMGQATGVDLVAAQHDGAITQGDWADMVTNCRGCGAAQACDRWLSYQALTGGVAQPPEYCENSATFHRLARVAAE